MSVRRAAPGDEAAIAGLLGELGYPVEPGALRERMARLPESTTVFVTDDLTGLVALDLRQGLQQEAPTARVVALVVREDARGRGVARELLGTVEATARAAGCRHLHVTSAHRRADAHAAYRALGFRETGLRLGKDLP